jgi:hypothetical protein
MRWNAEPASVARKSIPKNVRHYEREEVLEVVESFKRERSRSGDGLFPGFRSLTTRKSKERGR